MARLVTIFGGSGFLGRHLTQALAKRGWRVRAAVRRPDLAGHLQPLGMVGQIHAVQANLRYPDSVARAVAGADAVVNLVGILHEGGRQTFSAVQAQGPRIVAEAAASISQTKAGLMIMRPPSGWRRVILPNVLLGFGRILLQNT